ncbi:MAG: excinuclease ABC subunit UvrA [Candidatus Eisenbacteria bacterium]|nr:excinuclease ABC subunit UvrA [Candidatus Eisenbacteria bacterium]
MKGIEIHGAREHNLKNIDVFIPRNKLTVITGVSGSGKSSLAFDTVYAEGQRRYVESLSAYARQFLSQMEKPDVDGITGLSPSISIEQRKAGHNPRSTVATITEIYDYLRLIFSRIGTQYCPQCKIPISRQTVQEMVDRVYELSPGTKLSIYAPLVRGRKGEYRKEIEALRQQGFLRARIDGHVRELEGITRLEKTKKHTIDVLIDKISVDEKFKRRASDSIELALKAGSGLVKIETSEEKELLFSEKASCTKCGKGFDELLPRMFSFNSPYGACKSCDGLGTMLEIEPELVIPDKSLSILEAAIAPWGKLSSGGWHAPWVKALSKKYGFRTSDPWKKIGEDAKNALLFGTEDEFKVEYVSEKSKFEYSGPFEGVIPNLKRRYKETKSEAIREWIHGFMAQRICGACGGTRLKPEALSVKIGDLTIADCVKLQVKDAKRVFSALRFGERDRIIAEPIMKEIRQRLDFLSNVGLDYLTLDRASSTLAGGEAQRIRLATQIGSKLVGVLYILDEPSIGLHNRDNEKLLNTLKTLRDLGNTVVVVEHDRDTILSSDWIVDLGPGAGKAGGYVVASGTPAEIALSESSLTGQYISGRKEVPLPPGRKLPDKKWLSVIGASENNLKEIDVSFPIGLLTCVTGVSGSGKSTLVNDILYRALARYFLNSTELSGKHKKIAGLEHLDKVAGIDQSPIGRTPRSNPATYTGLFAPIRDLFSQFPESRVRGYRPGRFSFNVKGGRCEACEGDGVVKIEMHFLPDVYVKCEVCGGKRYNRETLEIKYKGKNISEVLDMTVDEALEFFRNIPGIRRKLETLKDVGLGYIHLGQSATTLSGGEAQRVKLATELSKIATGKTLYLLDEPTTGLHFEDVKMLLQVLRRLTEKGNTVVVIEHNLDVIKVADYIIDLGPEGGDEGGLVVAKGTPEEILNRPASYTGKALRKVMNPAAELSRVS